MNEEHTRKRGTLIVISGPSGVGKSPVIRGLLSKRPDIYFSVSFTTRAPRAGEVDGVNYSFVDREEFERMIAEDELLEYAEYVGNYYGTSIKVIREHLEKGQDVLLDIEVQGAAKVRARRPEAVFVFILPPSLEELVRRLEARSTDSKDVIARRMERARTECFQADNYDYIVVNDSVGAAVDELTSILTAEGCRVNNRAWMARNIANLKGNQ